MGYLGAEPFCLPNKPNAQGYVKEDCHLNPANPQAARQISEHFNPRRPVRRMQVFNKAAAVAGDVRRYALAPLNPEESPAVRVGVAAAYVGLAVLAFRYLRRR